MTLAIATTKKTKGIKWTRKKQRGVKKRSHGERVLGRPYTGSAHDDCLLMLMCSSGSLAPKQARRVIKEGGRGNGEWLRGNADAWGDDA